MPDGTTRLHRIDRRRVSLSQDHQVRYWTHKLDCTEEQLREAVSKAGSSEVEKVRQQLARA